MCGRYVQTKRARAAALRLIQREKMPAPRPETWNLAPSTQSMVVRRHVNGLTTDWLSWGIGMAQVRPINARVESAPDKPLFADAWRSRRCVVPADGWYEWRLEHGRKQPYYFSRRDDEPIFFAGLWTGQTFCILTTAADSELRQIHDRRPLALPTSDISAWIEGMPPAADQLVSRAIPAGEIAFRPVSAKVSSPRNDGPELIAAVTKPDPSPETMELFPNPF